ncbi:hypothetical protein QFC19_007724 [Naganishia cerealis]|uniref:Uncharacterized protein n=1 Tax=Naganishia cerealis TaxID=610337 RepID=A0ACC2V785_9TREE|nr:hypothetical protein QFC19_007724 [Naganishia cerealis]
MYDVTIIGAGFAGLTAARTILKTAAKARVVVLEAQKRTGGRCLTVHHLPGPVDVGCSWIHGYKEGSAVRDLVEELRVECYTPQKAKGSVLTAKGPLDPSLTTRLSKNLSNALGSAASNTTATSEESLASSIFAPSSELFSQLASPEERNLAKSLARTLEIGMGVQLEDVSLRWFGYEDSAKGTDAAIVGGYDVLIEKLVNEVEGLGGEVRLGQHVEAVVPSSGDSHGVKISINDQNGGKADIASRLVVSSIPLSLLQKGHTSLFPSLSSRKQHAIESTHVGQLGKIVLSYDKAWWPTDIGVFTVLPKQERGKAKRKPITWVKPHATLLVYLPVPVVEHLEGKSASEVGQAMHDYLSTSLPIHSASTAPKTSVLTNWAHDPYSLGATSTPLTVKSVSAGVDPTSFIELGRPETLGAADGKPRVLFAGEHTSVNNRGSVTGAVESGLREGRRAVHLLDL